jgi:hypothetical protein
MVIVGAQPVSPTITLAEWTAANVDAVHWRISACRQPQTTALATLAGEPALRLTYHCNNGWYAIFVYSLHHGQGWTAWWGSYTGNEELDTRTFEHFLTSFTFLK